MITLEKSIGRLEIKVQLVYIGKDLLIIVSGGDTPHIGAITTFGTKDKEETKLFTKHRDDEVSKIFAKDLKTIFNGNCVICAGIHLDNITKDEINDVRILSQQLSIEAASILKGERKWI